MLETKCLKINVVFHVLLLLTESERCHSKIKCTVNLSCAWAHRSVGFSDVFHNLKRISISLTSNKLFMPFLSIQIQRLLDWEEPLCNGALFSKPLRLTLWTMWRTQAGGDNSTRVLVCTCTSLCVYHVFTIIFICKSSQQLNLNGDEKQLNNTMLPPPCFTAQWIQCSLFDRRCCFCAKHICWKYTAKYLPLCHQTV